MSILTIYGHLLSIFILFFLLKTEVSELKITAILKPNDVLPQYMLSLLSICDHQTLVQGATQSAKAESYIRSDLVFICNSFLR